MRIVTLAGAHLLVFCTVLGGCDQKSSGGAPSSGSGVPVALAPEGGAATQDAGGSAKAASGAAGSFTGTYTSKQATDPAPRKADDDGAQGVGEGTVTLTVADDKTAKGTLDGPLGESVLTGTSSGDTMSGTLFPKQATPTSFYGTWVLEKKEGALKGKIVASRGNAGAVREADITLKGK